jgi:pyrimidine-nucleoside phosphorylase
VSGIEYRDLIELKRDGHEHDASQIEQIVLGFTRGEMPDYQMSAWLMAAVLRGLSADETIAMTEAMVHSGDVVDLSGIDGIKVDKHSTGGVADTTTLVLAPMVAACGVPVAKMSGRGLGHTGGTLDKLASIPGFRTELSAAEFVAQVQRIGVAIIAQSPAIDPADRLIYALRDVTGTVPSIPLIVASIISKKIAGGADAIVLDVKVGSGAFMKTAGAARDLAHDLMLVGRSLGREVTCITSGMDQPLGMAVGNALEVEEAISTLKGNGPADLSELCMVLGAKMLLLGGRAQSQSEARTMLSTAITSGAALERFESWVEAQGGDARIAEDPSLLPAARLSRDVRASSAGWVSGFDTEMIGRAAVALGAGRSRVEDSIDPGAGLALCVRIGDRVERGDVLCTLYAASDDLLDEGEQRFLHAIHIGEGHVPEAVFVRDLGDDSSGVPG